MFIVIFRRRGPSMVEWMRSIEALLALPSDALEGIRDDLLAEALEEEAHPRSELASHPPASATLDSGTGQPAEAREAFRVEAAAIEVPLSATQSRASTIVESYAWGELQNFGAALHRYEEPLLIAEQDLASLQSENARLEEDLASRIGLEELGPVLAEDPKRWIQSGEVMGRFALKRCDLLVSIVTPF
ncbi:hypothetical protein Nepgr_027386 [Nepenthes gracilis]|uniref:Uncharacterized protein n=1 Tax=Nepenthes gracilis TaxID=150966 RepID=A0AAD3Y1E9_NEPGR|nr:hypothetical protein Nepgr_027386 [Nepenthes gracilis]